MSADDVTAPPAFLTRSDNPFIERKGEPIFPAIGLDFAILGSYA